MSNKTTLQALDSSPWVNLLRYGIALNALCTNGFLLFLFVKCRSLRSSQCNLLIAANAFVEFVIGFGLAVRGTFEFVAMSLSISSFSHSLCVWIGSPLTGGFSANQITILALALDRLMAIVRPFSYSQRRQPFLSATFCLASLFFLAAVFISLWHIDDSNASSQCSMGANAGPLFATVWSIYAQISTLLVFGIYISMLLLFYHQKKALFHSPSLPQRQAVQVDGITGNQTRRGTAMNAWSENKDLETYQKQQLTISVALILFIYSLCWALPTAVWFLFNLFDPFNRTRINYVTFFQGFLTPCGAGFNFYMFLWKHAEIRNCARSTLPVLNAFLGHHSNGGNGAVIHQTRIVSISRRFE